MARARNVCVSFALALALLPMWREPSLAARQQQDGGFFGALFGSPSPPREPFYQRERPSNPFLRPNLPQSTDPILRKRTIAKEPPARRQNLQRRKGEAP